VADGRLREDDHYFRGMVDGQPATGFPVPVTRGRMQRGQERYAVYCATCHGLAGHGDGITSQRAFEGNNPKWIKPLSLHNQSVRDQPVGQLFQTITNGVRTMAAYGPQIPVEDRWAIVLYIRALQRTQNASIDDVPEELQDALR
jgi:mono/diheme cytochrome c family protein